MPKVPQYEEQVRVTAPSLSVPTQSAPVQGAFGADIAQAGERLGKAVSGIGEKLAEHAITMRREADAAKVFEAQVAFQRENQKLLNDTSFKDDENKIPKGVLQRSLSSAQGALSEYQTAGRDLQQKFLDSLEGEHQRQAFLRATTNDLLLSEQHVNAHEAKETRAWKKESASSAIKSNISQAALTSDPAMLDRIIQNSQTIANESLRFDGLQIDGKDKAIADQKRAEIAGAHVKEAFTAALEKSPAQAAAILKAFGPKMPGDQLADLQKHLEGKQLYDLSVNTWKQVSGLRLSDGNPDLESIQKQIMAMPGITTEKKLKLWDFSEAKAKEEMQQRKLQDAAGDTTFKNDILGMKAQGGKLEDALKLVASPKYGTADNVTVADRKEAAKKLWTEKTTTDPETYNKLWFDISEGRAARGEIDRAFQEGKLSASDWQGLGKHWYGIEHKNDDVLMKSTMDRVHILADQTFPSGGSGKKAKHEFLYMVMQQAKGKNPEEVLDLANKFLEKDPNRGLQIFGSRFFSPDQYKSELELSDAQNQFKAMATKELGPEVTDAILSGAKRKDRAADPVATLDEFAKAFGGREKLAPGTNVNKVIRAMQNRGWTVTPDTVRNVMKQKGLEP